VSCPEVPLGLQEKLARRGIQLAKAVRWDDRQTKVSSPGGGTPRQFTTSSSPPFKACKRPCTGRARRTLISILSITQLRQAPRSRKRGGKGALLSALPQDADQGVHVSGPRAFLSRCLADGWKYNLIRSSIPGTCVQYPGVQGDGALSDAPTSGTQADSIAASAHGGTYSHVSVAGETWGGEKGAAAGNAAAEARRRRATPTGGAFTLPRSAPLTAPLDGRPTGRRNQSRRAGTITRGSLRARSTTTVAARGRRAQLGAVGGDWGAGTVRAL